MQLLGEVTEIVICESDLSAQRPSAASARPIKALLRPSARSIEGVRG